MQEVTANRFHLYLYISNCCCIYFSSTTLTVEEMEERLRFNILSDRVSVNNKFLAILTLYSRLGASVSVTVVVGGGGADDDVCAAY